MNTHHPIISNTFKIFFLKANLFGIPLALLFTGLLAANFITGLNISAYAQDGLDLGPAENVPKESNTELDLSEMEVAISVGDEPFTGFLIPPATDTNFRFKLADSGDILTFRWSTLIKSDRIRIQKLFGIEVEDGTIKWGYEVKCVRFQMKSKRYVEGFEDKFRSIPGHRCLRTATQIVQIPMRDIETESVIMKRESEIKNAEEKYEELMMERPPDFESASEHMEFARMCSNMGLYDKAIDHLEMAKVIDPRTEDRTKEFRMELVRKHAETLARKLYHRILFDLNGSDFSSALDKILRLKRNFPNSEYYTRVDGMQADVEKGAETDFVKQVIFMFYTSFNDLIRQKLTKRVRVDKDGHEVAARPGKQVTTLSGRIFRGELLEESSDEVVIQQGDTTLTVEGNEILSIQDVELSTSFTTVMPTFKELKAYVTNKDAGLGKDIIDYIAIKLKADRQRVQDAWDSRTVKTATYKDGVLVTSKTWATLHVAYYGKGSWLRDGVRQTGGSNNGGGSSRNRNRGNGSRGSRPSGGGGGVSVTPAPVRENPETSDDPEVWWRGQKSVTQYNLLRALGSEKLFRVKKPITGKPCPECGMKGKIQVFDGFGAGRWYRCPTCRGLRLLTQIHYE